MIANGIVVPAYADGLAWTIAMLSMVAEVATAVVLLQRCGLVNGRPLRLTLIGLNFATWTAFLYTVDALRLAFEAESMPMLGLLELAVVAVEGLAIWTAGRAPCLWPADRPGRLSLWRACGVSAITNAVSITISVALSFLVIAILR